MNKKDKDAFIEKIKRQRKPERIRTSFLLDKDTYSAFIKACENANVTASSVIHQFMKDFAADTK